MMRHSIYSTDWFVYKGLMEMLGDVRDTLYPCQETLLILLTDFDHDMSRKRAYRWGEDGIAGVSDTHGLLNVAFSFWNEKE